MFPVTFPPTFPLSFSFHVAFFPRPFPLYYFISTSCARILFLPPLPASSSYVFLRFLLMSLTISGRYLAFRVNVNDDKRLLQFLFYPLEVIPVDLCYGDVIMLTADAMVRPFVAQLLAPCAVSRSSRIFIPRGFTPPCNSILVNAAFRVIVIAESKQHRKSARKDVLFKYQIRIVVV